MLNILIQFWDLGGLRETVYARTRKISLNLYSQFWVKEDQQWLRKISHPLRGETLKISLMIELAN